MISINPPKHMQCGHSTMVSINPPKHTQCGHSTMVSINPPKHTQCGHSTMVSINAPKHTQCGHRRDPQRREKWAPSEFPFTATQKALSNLTTICLPNVDTSKSTNIREPTKIKYHKNTIGGQEGHPLFK